MIYFKLDILQVPTLAMRRDGSSSRVLVLEKIRGEQKSGCQTRAVVTCTLGDHVIKYIHCFVS
jgi:hypothetical protein